MSLPPSEGTEFVAQAAPTHTRGDAARRPRAGAVPAARGRPTAAGDGRGAGGRRGRCGRRRQHRRARAARRRGPRGHPAAAARGHHPPAGLGQGPRPRTDSGGDLRGVAFPRPDLARRSTRADADHAPDRRLHRARLGRNRVRAGRPGHAPGEHLLRRLLHALPAAPLRRRRHAGGRRLQRGRDQREQVGRPRGRTRLVRRRGRHPVQGDARLRARREGEAPGVSRQLQATSWV